MTAEPSQAVLDRRDDGRGAVPHDDDAALSPALFLSAGATRRPSKPTGDDTYARRILDALQTVREVSGCAVVNTIRFCSCVILITTLLSHLSQTFQPLLHSASYSVTLLYFHSEAAIPAFSAPLPL